ncbi:autotransporter assembly complex family protein [Acidocella sp.]|uniref:autotransporter assembly complex protein TamA n=1 Tax=Acidocella sp. TaxID=50710 RepID=UPI0026224732|nr:BamA/TamA family outer membrane protein [Acidocella sp.]MDD2796069.1 BamA/TamA family outer membrane protein [Acidocella sp.]
MAVFIGRAALAADPVSYTVNFVPSGDGALDGLLRQSSALVAVQKKLPAGPFALIGRARGDARKFAVVLHSLGYDGGSVEITIGGDALGDPALLDMLNALPQGQAVAVRVTPHQGAQFRLGKVQTPGLPPGFVVPPMVKPGQPALAAPILAAAPALRAALRNAGYAFAEVSQPWAVARLATHRLDVTYTITPGPRVRIGPVSFEGLARTNAAFLRQHIALRPGQPFSDTSLALARDSLLGLGVFAAVTPVPAGKAAADGEVPVVFRVVPQKRHAVTLSALYATDTGLTLGTSWEDRDVFTHAERLKFTAAGNGLAATGTRAPGYDLKAVFAKPDFAARGQMLSVSLEALNESLTAYSRKALLGGVALSRPLGAHLSFTYGPQFITERVRQQGVNRDYALAQLPVTLSYSTADNLLEPTSGVNAAATVTPTLPTAGTGKPFIIAQASMAGYIPVEPAGRGVLALRGQVGSIQGAGVFQVPPDQRFYAGGSGTVRGYTYQTIGPLFPDGAPEGGLAMDAASLEFRQRVGKSFGVVPFIDAGQVNAGSRPFAGTLRVGAGLGLRYYTSIGPIRLDLAFPFTRVAGSGAFALYAGFGEAF